MTATAPELVALGVQPQLAKAITAGDTPAQASTDTTIERFGRYSSGVFQSLIELRTKQTITALAGGMGIGRGCIRLNDTVGGWTSEYGAYEWGHGIFTNAPVFEIWTKILSVRDLTGGSTPKFMVRDAGDLTCISIYHDGTNAYIATSDGTPGPIIIKPNSNDCWTFDLNGDLRGNTANGGDIIVNHAGKSLKYKEGANGCEGQATLAAGTVTVATTAVVATSRIHLTRATTGGTPGHLSYTVNAGTSFTINSTSGTETSTVNWLIIQSS